jgi:hypothetical protein
MSVPARRKSISLPNEGMGGGVVLVGAVSGGVAARGEGVAVGSGDGSGSVVAVGSANSVAVMLGLSALVAVGFSNPVGMG